MLDVDDGQPVESEDHRTVGIGVCPGAGLVGAAVAHQVRRARDCAVGSRGQRGLVGLGELSIGALRLGSAGRGRNEGQQSTHGAPVCRNWRSLWGSSPAGRHLRVAGPDGCRPFTVPDAHPRGRSRVESSLGHRCRAPGPVASATRRAHARPPWQTQVSTRLEHSAPDEFWPASSPARAAWSTLRSIRIRVSRRIPPDAASSTGRPSL